MLSLQLLRLRMPVWRPAALAAPARIITSWQVPSAAKQSVVTLIGSDRCWTPCRYDSVTLACQHTALQSSRTIQTCICFICCPLLVSLHIPTGAEVLLQLCPNARQMVSVQRGSLCTCLTAEAEADCVSSRACGHWAGIDTVYDVGRMRMHSLRLQQCWPFQ